MSTRLWPPPPPPPFHAPGHTHYLLKRIHKAGVTLKVSSQGWADIVIHCRRGGGGGGVVSGDAVVMKRPIVPLGLDLYPTATHWAKPTSIPRYQGFKSFFAFALSGFWSDDHFPVKLKRSLSRHWPLKLNTGLLTVRPAAVIDLTYCLNWAG